MRVHCGYTWALLLLLSWLLPLLLLLLRKLHLLMLLLQLLLRLLLNARWWLPIVIAGPIRIILFMNCVGVSACALGTVSGHVSHVTTDKTTCLAWKVCPCHACP